MLKPRIRIKLAELELKQVDIHEEFNVGKQQFSNWVRGTSYPDLVNAFKLAHRLNCRVDDLWEYRGG